MPTSEEKLRVLLLRIGHQPGRTVIAQAVRQDATLAGVLPWIAENITEAQLLDPQLRDDYESLRGRLSLPLDPGDGGEGTEWAGSEEVETARWEEFEAELQTEVASQQAEMTSLAVLMDQLSFQLEATGEKLKYAREEERVYLTPLLRSAEDRATASCHGLASDCDTFASALRQYLDQTKTVGGKLHFTQAEPGSYWRTSVDLTRQFERMMGSVVASHHQGTQRHHRVDQWIELSDLAQQPWFLELERVRQHKQISDVRQIEMLLSRNKTELRCKFIKQTAYEFLSNPGPHPDGFAAEWKERPIDECRAENKKRTAKKKALVKQIVFLLKESNRLEGMEALKSYMERILDEWNSLSIQKHELLNLVCQQMNRDHLFTMMAEVENRSLEVRIQYMERLCQTFHRAAAVARHRREALVPSEPSRADFIHPDDHYLQFIASFTKFCQETVGAHPEVDSSLTSQTTTHKRQFSSAFSETTGPGGASSSFTPASKLTKEQQKGLDVASSKGGAPRQTSPAELEVSLRRLSVCEEQSNCQTSLFGDSSENDGQSVTPLHEVTLQSQRLLALPSAAHQSLGQLFPETLLSTLLSKADLVRSMEEQLFAAGQSTLKPGLSPAQDSLEQLIQALHQRSRDVKTRFKGHVKFLEQQPETERRRRAKAEFFTRLLSQRQERRKPM